MKLLIGEHHHRLDGKGRLTIPSNFREILGDEVVVTCGYDGALDCYRLEDFNTYAENLLALPFDDSTTRGRVRRAFAMAAQLKFDRLGRILLPRTLIEKAGFKDDIVIAGLGNRLEFWSEETFKQQIDMA
jgi:MraZ protein